MVSINYSAYHQIVTFLGNFLTLSTEHSTKHENSSDCYGFLNFFTLTIRCRVARDLVGTVYHLNTYVFTLVTPKSNLIIKKEFSRLI